MAGAQARPTEEEPEGVGEAAQVDAARPDRPVDGASEAAGAQPRPSEAASGAPMELAPEGPIDSGEEATGSGEAAAEMAREDVAEPQDAHGAAEPQGDEGRPSEAASEALRDVAAPARSINSGAGATEAASEMAREDVRGADLSAQAAPADRSEAAPAEGSGAAATIGEVTPASAAIDAPTGRQEAALAAQGSGAAPVVAAPAAAIDPSTAPASASRHQAGDGVLEQEAGEEATRHSAPATQASPIDVPPSAVQVAPMPLEGASTATPRLATSAPQASRADAPPSAVQVMPGPPEGPSTATPTLKVDAAPGPPEPAGTEVAAAAHLAAPPAAHLAQAGDAELAPHPAIVADGRPGDESALGHAAASWGAGGHFAAPAAQRARKGPVARDESVADSVARLDSAAAQTAASGGERRPSREGAHPRAESVAESVARWNVAGSARQPSPAAVATRAQHAGPISLPCAESVLGDGSSVRGAVGAFESVASSRSSALAARTAVASPPAKPKPAAMTEAQRRAHARSLAEGLRPAVPDNAPDGERAIWIVVGGEDTGGILVRKEEELTSPMLPARLVAGSTIEQLELLGNRLKYRSRICLQSAAVTANPPQTNPNSTPRPPPTAPL